MVWPGAGIACPSGIPPGFYPPHINIGLPILPASASLLPPHCHHTISSPPQLPISILPICLDEYFFFKSLVVGLPYSLVFWQFWLYFVLRLVVIPLVVVQGGEVCLPTTSSWLDVKFLLLKDFPTALGMGILMCGMHMKI